MGDRAELLFSEVLNALRQFVEKRSGIGSVGGSTKALESRHQLVDLEGMLHKEKSEFEVRLFNVHILFVWPACSCSFVRYMLSSISEI